MLFVTNKAFIKDNHIVILTHYYPKTNITNVGGGTAYIEQSNDLKQWDFLVSVVSGANVDTTITRPYVRCKGSKVYIQSHGADFTYPNTIPNATPNASFSSTTTITDSRLQAVIDYVEKLMNSDSDSDGLSNIDEINKHKTNPYDIDTDKDYVSDKDEIIANTDPLDKNSYPTIMGYTHKQRDEIFKTIDTSVHLDKNLVTFNLPIFCYSLKHSIPMEVIYVDSDNITSNKTVDLKVVPTNPVRINVQRPTKLIKIELKFFGKSITIDIN